MKVILRRLDTRNMGPAQRLAFGFAGGVITVLGMWLISTLMHNEKYGLGLTWVDSLIFVLVTSLATLVSGWWPKEA